MDAMECDDSDPNLLYSLSKVSFELKLYHITRRILGKLFEIIPNHITGRLLYSKLFNGNEQEIQENIQPIQIEKLNLNEFKLEELLMKLIEFENYENKIEFQYSIQEKEVIKKRKDKTKHESNKKQKIDDELFKEIFKYSPILKELKEDIFKKEEEKIEQLDYNVTFNEQEIHQILNEFLETYKQRPLFYFEFLKEFLIHLSKLPKPFSQEIKKLLNVLCLKLLKYSKIENLEKELILFMIEIFYSKDVQDFKKYNEIRKCYHSFIIHEFCNRKEMEQGISLKYLYLFGLIVKESNLSEKCFTKCLKYYKEEEILIHCNLKMNKEILEQEIEKIKKRKYFDKGMEYYKKKEYQNLLNHFGMELENIEKYNSSILTDLRDILYHSLEDGNQYYIQVSLFLIKGFHHFSKSKQNMLYKILKYLYRNLIKEKIKDDKLYEKLIKGLFELLLKMDEKIPPIYELICMILYQITKEYSLLSYVKDIGNEKDIFLNEIFIQEYYKLYFQENMDKKDILQLIHVTFGIHFKKSDEKIGGMIEMNDYYSNLILNILYKEDLFKIEILNQLKFQHEDLNIQDINDFLDKKIDYIQYQNIKNDNLFKYYYLLGKHYFSIFKKKNELESLNLAEENLKKSCLFEKSLKPFKLLGNIYKEMNLKGIRNENEKALICFNYIKDKYDVYDLDYIILLFTLNPNESIQLLKKEIENGKDSYELNCLLGLFQQELNLNLVNCLELYKNSCEKNDKYKLSFYQFYSLQLQLFIEKNYESTIQLKLNTPNTSIKKKGYLENIQFKEISHSYLKELFDGFYYCLLLDNYDSQSLFQISLIYYHLKDYDFSLSILFHLFKKQTPKFNEKYKKFEYYKLEFFIIEDHIHTNDKKLSSFHTLICDLILNLIEIKKDYLSLRGLIITFKNLKLITHLKRALNIYFNYLNDSFDEVNYLFGLYYSWEFDDLKQNYLNLKEKIINSQFNYQKDVEKYLFDKHQFKIK